MIDNYKVLFTKNGHSYGWYECPICKKIITSRVNKSLMQKIKSCKSCSVKLKIQNYEETEKFSNGIKKLSNCKDCNCLLNDNNRHKYNKNQCKKCKNEKTNQNRKRNKIRDKEYSLIYNEKAWHKKIVHRIKRINKDTDITPEFILDLWEKQNGLCYWFKIPMKITSKSKHPSKPSLDRLDNNKSYTKDNCVLCCFSANMGRNENTVDDWLEFINEIKININKNN